MHTPQVLHGILRTTCSPEERLELLEGEESDKDNDETLTTLVLTQCAAHCRALAGLM